jgi:hypothetical protein
MKTKQYTKAFNNAYIVCGHIAIVATALTTVWHNKNCGGMNTVKTKLCPLDRVVKREVFANLTGQRIVVQDGPLATKEYTPKKVRPVKPKTNVFDFISKNT